MTTTSAQQTVFEELVTATKILLHEGILDTFGHISARDPEDPNAFFLAQKLACDFRMTTSGSLVTCWAPATRPNTQRHISDCWESIHEGGYS